MIGKPLGKAIQILEGSKFSTKHFANTKFGNIRFTNETIIRTRITCTKIPL